MLRELPRVLGSPVCEHGRSLHPILQGMHAARSRRARAFSAIAHAGWPAPMRRGTAHGLPACGLSDHPLGAATCLASSVKRPPCGSATAASFLACSPQKTAVDASRRGRVASDARARPARSRAARVPGRLPSSCARRGTPSSAANARGVHALWTCGCSASREGLRRDPTLTLI